MKSIIGLLFICIVGVLLISPADSGPLRTWDSNRRPKIEPGKPGVLQMPFRGGERACVLVEGDHNPPMKISLKVIEMRTKRVVAEDESVDYCCAIWYPPEDEMYQIEIAVHGPVWNQITILIK